MVFRIKEGRFIEFWSHHYDQGKMTWSGRSFAKALTARRYSAARTELESFRAHRRGRTRLDHEVASETSKAPPAIANADPDPRVRS